MPPAIRSRAAMTSASESIEYLEGKHRAGLRGGKHAPKIVLDPCERCGVLRFESQHDHRRRVRRARQAEAIGVFDAQSVDADDTKRTREFGAMLQSIDQR